MSGQGEIGKDKAVIDILQVISFMPARNSWEAWNELHLMACKIKREREANECSSESIPGTTTQGAGK